MHYTYDDLLSQMDGPNGAMTGYGYDAFNRRIYKTDQDGNTTVYLYDGLDVLQEVTGQNDQKIATYYRANGQILTRQEFNVSQDDTALYQNRPTGRQLYYSYDGLGSTAALTDHNGRLVTSYQYDAYGQLTGGDIKENTYTFTGKRFDEESGLYHFHFRKYDPVVGVWTTEDPIGVLGGVNVYGYVGNGPVNWVDWLGLCETTQDIINRINSSAYQPFLDTGDSYGFLGDRWTSIEVIDKMNFDVSSLVPDVIWGVDSPAGGFKTTLPFGSGGDIRSIQTSPSFNWPGPYLTNIKVGASVDPVNIAADVSAEYSTPLSGISTNQNGEISFSGPQVNFPFGYGVNGYVGIEW